MIEKWVRVYRIKIDSRIPKHGRLPFWVAYTFYRNGNLEHSGERLVHAVDELDLFKVFPEQMDKRHGTNNVTWDLIGETQ